jgi:Rieske Fe-S protein
MKRLTMCDRREFLQTAGCFGATLAACGLFDVEAIAWTTGTQVGDQRRYPIPMSDGVSIDRNAQVILVRSQNKVMAMALACPHQNAAVRWLPDDRRFQCTRHDSMYQPDGTYTSGRATRNLDRFPIQKDGVSVLVDVSRVFRSDQETAGWAAAVVIV